MKKITNKGFTLIELLVTMAILGIITGISFPLIRNIQETQEKRKYTVYRDSIEYAAKLYLDSYKRDLFGYDEDSTSCAYITYEQLKDKNLISNIEIDNVTCDSPKTYVKVIKYGKDYMYHPYITCGIKGEDGVFEDVIYNYPEGNHERDEVCGLATTANMNLVPNVQQTEESAKDTKINFRITSYNGFNDTIVIKYAFSNAPESLDVFTDWNLLSFQVPSRAKQKEMILEGDSGVTITSQDIHTPAGHSGTSYLVIKVEMLKDLSGRDWDDEGKRYFYFGPYRDDNDAPVISYSRLEYEDDKWYLYSEYTEETNFEARVWACGRGTENDFCDERTIKTSTSVVLLLELNSNRGWIENYVPYTGNYSSPKFCFRLYDYAMNLSDFACTTDVLYKTRYYNNTSSSDNTYNVREISNPGYISKWSNYSAAPDTIPTGYVFTGWSKTRTGTVMENNLDVSFPIKEVYAQWSPINYSISYSLGGGSVSPENPANYTIETATFTLKNPTKKGYSFTGWTGSNGSTKQKTVKVTKGSSGNKSYTANWSKTSYSITYELNGGTLATSNPASYYVDTNTFTLNNPTKTGKTFKGWTGSNGSTPQKTVQIAKGSTGNKTYTAVWE